MSPHLGATKRGQEGSFHCQLRWENHGISPSAEKPFADPEITSEMESLSLALYNNTAIIKKYDTSCSKPNETPPILEGLYQPFLVILGWFILGFRFTTVAGLGMF